MVSLFSQWKSQLFFLPFGFSRALFSFIKIGAEGEVNAVRGGRRKYVHSQNRVFASRAPKNLCAPMIFAFICTFNLAFRPPPRPRRANPAPTKGSVTFLNEEINLSWHPSPAHALALAFMVISFRKGGETICDSIRRGFYALIWFTNLSFSLSAFCFIFLHTAAVRCFAGYCAKNHFFRAQQNKNWISCETSESQHILSLLKNCLSMFLINPRTKYFSRRSHLLSSLCCVLY